MLSTNRWVEDHWGEYELSENGEVLLRTHNILRAEQKKSTKISKTQSDKWEKNQRPENTRSQKPR